MSGDSGKMISLRDAMREVVPNNGWLEAISGKKRGKWTPELLEAAVKDYFMFADGSPLPKDIKLSSKVGGKGGDVDEDMKRKVMRPYNIRSMCSRLGISDWERFKSRYCNETTEEGIAFTELCASIENFIYGHLQEGAVAGIYNAKMVMGLTGVAEHVKQEVNNTYGDISDEELRAACERMERIVGGGE